jgi:hypothetical protein
LLYQSKSRPVLLPFVAKEMNDEDQVADAKDICELEDDSENDSMKVSALSVVPKDKVNQVSKITSSAKLLTKIDPKPYRLNLTMVQDAMNA